MRKSIFSRLVYSWSEFMLFNFNVFLVKQEVKTQIWIFTTASCKYGKTFLLRLLTLFLFTFIRKQFIHFSLNSSNVNLPISALSTLKASAVSGRLSVELIRHMLMKTLPTWGTNYHQVSWMNLNSTLFAIQASCSSGWARIIFGRSRIWKR